MARKRVHADHENHERWLISYADFITLLFAFFVLMFATSQVDKGKAQAVSDSVKKALDGEPAFNSMVKVILGGTVDHPGAVHLLADQRTFGRHRRRIGGHGWN